MNPKELSTYDNYPKLLTDIIQWAANSTRFPLDEMRAAAQRMGVTNAFIGPLGTQQVDTQTLLDHQDLLELVMNFRDRYVELALRSQRSV